MRPPDTAPLAGRLASVTQYSLLAGAGHVTTRQECRRYRSRSPRLGDRRSVGVASWELLGSTEKSRAMRTDSSTVGAPGRIRTCDPRIRSPLLYPAELQAHTAGDLLGRGKRGAGDGIRTRDNQLGRLELYQLSYTRLLTHRSVVGTRGFEPPTPCSQSRCATRLRHVPTATYHRLRPREYTVKPLGLTLEAFVHYT
jgi:hypothetical protein